MITAILLFASCLGVVDDSTQAGHEKGIALLRTIPKEGKSTSGTGFLIALNKERCWMVTCAHVVKNAMSVRVDFSKFESCAVTEVYLDEAHDLALLHLSKDAPPNAIPFELRAGDEHGQTKGKFDLNMVGLARGFGNPTTVPAAFHSDMQAKDVGLAVDVQERLRLDPKCEVIEVGVVGEEGTSGSAITDSEGFVIGVYFAGQTKGRSDIGFGIRHRYIRSIGSAQKLQLNTDVRNMLDLATYNMTVVSNPQSREATDNLPQTNAVIEQFPATQIFEKFFASSKAEANKDWEQMVKGSIKDKQKKINHVTSSVLNVGFLVPEGYELSDKYDSETKACLLTISKPGSHYKARIYSRPLGKPGNDSANEKNEFGQETVTFLSNVLHFMVSPELMANQSGQANLAAGSWPALFRGGEHNCLQTFRVYEEPAKQLLHAYGLELCMRTNRFQCNGISFPKTASVNGIPSEEFKELGLILNSIYDLDIGIEKTIEMSASRSFVEVQKLPTPLTSNATLSAFQNLFPSPPLLFDPNVNPTMDQHLMQRPILTVSSPENRQDPRSVLQPRNALQPGEFFAANLGIFYRPIVFPNGCPAIVLTRQPIPNSPAAKLNIQGLAGGLEIGDKILLLDGIPPLSPEVVLNHVQTTRIDFIDVRTLQIRTALTFIPINLGQDYRQ